MSEQQKFEISLFDFVLSISHNLNLIYEDLKWHHEKVAYIVYELISELNYSVEEKKTLIMSAALHDIGILNLEHEQINVIKEVELTAADDIVDHAKIGAILINRFEKLFNFAGMKDLIKYHHVNWNNKESNKYQGDKMLYGSHIIHLADRIAILTGKEHALNQKNDILDTIKSNSGSAFAPKLVELLTEVAQKDSFWLTLENPKLIERQLKNNKEVDLNVKLDL
ncbi:MAG: HD domain-containing protein, partial [Bacillota bacterium]